VIESIVKGFGFAAVGLGEDDDLAGGFFAGEDAAHDFQRSILGAVVDDDDAQVGIIGIKRALNRAFDDLLLIVGGDEDRDLGSVSGNLFGRAKDVRTETVVESKDADENEATGHQDIAEKEDDGDGRHGRAEQPEADPVQARGPALIGGQGGHDVGFGFPEQLVDGDKLESAGASALNDEREGEHGSLAIAAAIVHENDIAASLQIVRFAGRQVIEDLGGDLLGRERRQVVPVFCIELVADGDVAQALSKIERLDLIFGIGLGVH
jgi:hypothetical protein